MMNLQGFLMVSLLGKIWSNSSFKKQWVNLTPLAKIGLRNIRTSIQNKIVKLTTYIQKIHATIQFNIKPQKNTFFTIIIPLQIEGQSLFIKQNMNNKCCISFSLVQSPTKCWFHQRTSSSGWDLSSS